MLDVAFNSEQDSKDIYISDQELTSLLSAWQSQVGRPPNDEEIVNIITVSYTHLTLPTKA